MTLLRRPVGIWILIAWCAVQAIAGIAMGFDSSGMRGTAVWGFAAAQALFIAGLALPFGPARHLVVAYLALKVFAVAVAVWAIVFVAVSWGLRQSDLPLILPVVGYQVFVSWAFLYLFDPDVQTYLRGYVNAPVHASHSL
jgi:hypothetical protein